MLHNKDEFGFVDHKIIYHIEHPGKAICLLCPPYRGENAGLRRYSRKRSDHYKNHRRRFGAQKLKKTSS